MEFLFWANSHHEIEKVFCFCCIAIRGVTAGNDKWMHINFKPYLNIENDASGGIFSNIIGEISIIDHRTLLEWLFLLRWRCSGEQHDLKAPDFQSRALFHGVCMISLCLQGFSLGSSHSANTCISLTWIGDSLGNLTPVQMWVWLVVCSITLQRAGDLTLVNPASRPMLTGIG